jgi:hypothetical protein
MMLTSPTSAATLFLLGLSHASPLPRMQTMGRAQLNQAIMAAKNSDPVPQANCEDTKTCNAGVYFDELVCHLNSKVNASTFEAFKWEIQGLWQPYCAINRGIFVLAPGNDGWENHTYSCGTLPTDWGIDNIGDLVNADVNVALHALDGRRTSPWATAVRVGLIG